MIKFNRGLSFVSEIIKAFCIGLKSREIIDTKQLKQIQTNFRNVNSIFSQAIFSLLLFFQTCDRTNHFPLSNYRVHKYVCSSLLSVMPLGSA